MLLQEEQETIITNVNKVIIPIPEFQGVNNLFFDAGTPEIFIGKFFKGKFCINVSMAIIRYSALLSGDCKFIENIE